MVFLFFLTFLLSTVFAQTQDCDNLSVMYFCIDSDTLKERIDWCWCYYGDNPGRWILDPYAFVDGGYVATQIFFDPKIPDYGVDTGIQLFGLMCAPRLLTFQYI